MRVHIYPLGPLQTNAYLICNEQSKEAVIVDAPMNPEVLLKQANAYQIKAILLTHAHFDHILGLNKMREATEAPVYIHKTEQEWLIDPRLNGSARWPGLSESAKCDPADYLIKDEQSLRLAGFDIKVLYTPGHSPGGVSFLIDQHLFCGDTLFAGSIGRTDLPGGSYEQLITNIQDKLMILPDDTICYPGHGPKTTIGNEKMSNPFITGILR